MLKLSLQKFFTHKQRKDLSIWTTAAVMANDLFTDDSFLVILGE